MLRLVACALLISAPSMAQTPYGFSPPFPPSSPSYPVGPGGYGSGSNPSSHYVNPYATRNGTYVAPHMQTTPNSTEMDNYGTRGNVNPYTGHIGSRTPRW